MPRSAGCKVSIPTLTGDNASDGAGFRAIAGWYPPDSLTMIYFSNLRRGATDLIRHRTPKIVAGDNVRPPVVPHPKAVALSPAAQQRLVGDYDTGGGDINTVTFASPSMIRWAERFLLAVDDSTFDSYADYAPVRFFVPTRPGLSMRSTGGRARGRPRASICTFRE
ncbi:MAG TPA: hypothetical protein VJ865_11235 [Gemmatimonadaceae bacterium]|nr:hypothetical protein [Gemmatimonadaceae bacterium]